MGQSNSCGVTTYHVSPQQELHLMLSGQYRLNPAPKCAHNICPAPLGTWKFKEGDSNGEVGILTFRQPMWGFQGVLDSIGHPVDPISQVWKIASVSRFNNGTTVLHAHYVSGTRRKPGMSDYPVSVHTDGQPSRWVHRSTPSDVPLPNC